LTFIIDIDILVAPFIMNLMEGYEKAGEKIGSPFKLCVILQKRVRELVKGAQPLVKVEQGVSPIEVALKEILEEKIFLKDGSDKSSKDKEKKR
jgi:DNA-directed RNA polymerase subunit K/omega